MRDRGSKGSGLIGLPKSAALARTTKELLEGDFFDSRDRGVEWVVTLLAQRRVARSKLNESSDQDENLVEDHPVRRKPQNEEEEVVQRSPKILSP